MLVIEGLSVKILEGFLEYMGILLVVFSVVLVFLILIEYNFFLIFVYNIFKNNIIRDIIFWKILWFIDVLFKLFLDNFKFFKIRIFIMRY